MPEDTKKNSQRGKNEGKEQRKRRQGRQHAVAEKKVERAPEKKIEQASETPKEPEKPAFEPPGPEFYSSLKRETDEILKITEEANSKYKKKEIQSNWAKYEMPIETYDEIDEQENLGADYETLIQASFSVGGHFQFRHEKSWDITTGPTPYDKYFEINMESLNTALSTIPFYERNNIDKSVFSDNDIQSMDHRATKFKQKYYNDKKYTTPDIEAQEKILNSLRKSDNETNSTYEDQNDFKGIKFDNYEPPTVESDNVGIDMLIKPLPVNEMQEKELPKELIENVSKMSLTPEKSNNISVTQETKISKNKKAIDNKLIDNDFDDLVQNVVNKNSTEANPEITLNQINTVPKEIELPKAPKEYPIHQPKETPKNPIIESPEDLEKWLDDFLDG